MVTRIALPTRIAAVLVLLAGMTTIVGVIYAGTPALYAGPAVIEVIVQSPVPGQTPVVAMRAADGSIDDGRGGMTGALAEASPTPRLPAPTPLANGASVRLDRGESGRREIALTFDAGADRGYAGVILDTLKQYGVKASFGLTGTWVKENPDLVKRMVDEGHMIINHTWSHASLTGVTTGTSPMSRSERFDELAKTEAVIAEVTGGYVTAPYFRPPYGDLDDSVLADVGAAGYGVTVMWSCDSMGWNGFTADQIIARCVDDAKPGAIILMHVGAASQDAVALPEMIERLQSQGYTLVTIEQMMQPENGQAG